MSQDNVHDVRLDDKVWKTYLDRAEASDKELIAGWEKGIDALLVFAALFSAVVSAFVIQSSSLLQPGVDDMTNALLAEILQQMRNSSVPSGAVTLVPDFQAPLSGLWINTLWYSSLISSLAAAFFALLARQWIQEYKQWMSIENQDTQMKARLRHFRHSGLQTWGMDPILRVLPFIIHVSLSLFFVGLVVYLDQFDRRMAIAAGVIVGLVITLYFLTLLLPIFFVRCAYRTLPLQVLQRRFFSLSHLALTGMRRLSPGSSSVKDLKTKVQNLDIDGQEVVAINATRHTLDGEVLMSLSPQFDKFVGESIAKIYPPVSEDLKRLFQKTRTWEMVENNYMQLVVVIRGPKGPIAKISDSNYSDAILWLRALESLMRIGALPENWKPGNRMSASWRWIHEQSEQDFPSAVKRITESLLDNFSLSDKVASPITA